MNDAISDLYTLPNIDTYQDLNLLDLKEYCAALETQVYAIAKSLPVNEQRIILAYISTRDDLETVMLSFFVQETESITIIIRMTNVILESVSDRNCESVLHRA